eukprot:gene27945-31567_t
MGETALIYASRAGNCEIVKLLLSYTAVNVNLQTHNLGHTDQALANLIGDHGKYVPAVRKNSNSSSNHTAAAPAVYSGSWLAEHLQKCGYDAAVVKDCEEKLVIQAGFMSETDFAVCPQSILNHEYLTSIGITKLGVQMNLLQLKMSLETKQNSAPALAVSSTGTSG